MSKSVNFSRLYRSNTGLLFISLFLGWIHYYFFHGGYLGFDEIEYARLAVLVNKGEFFHDSLYAYRYLGFLPLAFLNMILGYGDLPNWLFPMLTLLGVIFVVVKILESYPWEIRLISVLFLLFNPTHLLYLEKPMPDMVTELGFLLCFYSYYREKLQFEERQTNTNILFFFLGSVLIFLSKETFLIIYPFFLFWFMYDLIKKNRIRYWMKIFTGLVILLIIYFGVNGWFFGNPLARMEAIFSNRYVSECTYELQPLSVLWDRIVYRLWFDMTRMGFLWPAGFALVFLFFRKYGDEKLIFWVVSWFFLMVLSNFMTISYSEYVPLCNDPRHYLFVLPIGALIWAEGWKKSGDFGVIEKVLCLIFFLFQLYISITNSYENKWWLFLPFIAAIFLMPKPRFRIISFILVGVAMVGVFIQNANYNRTLNHKGQKELISSVLSLKNEKKYILTDGANTNIGSFYAQYDSLNTFVVFKEYDKQKHSDKAIYIIMNGMTAYFSNTDWGKVPDFVKTAQDSLPVFYQNKSGVVYKLD